MLVTDRQKYILTQTALNGGVINFEELCKQAEESGPFRSYSKEYREKFVDDDLVILTRKKILKEEKINEKRIFSMSEENLLSEIGETTYKAEDIKPDIEFFLRLQVICKEIERKGAFFIAESDLGLGLLPEDIRTEIHTAYELFRNSKTPTQYALVIAACRRASEAMREKTTEIASIDIGTKQHLQVLMEILNKKGNGKIKAISAGLYAIHKEGSAKGAHIGTEANKIDAIGTLLYTIWIAKLFRIILFNEMMKGDKSVP